MAFQPLIHDFITGSGNEPVPTGSTNLVQEIWGTGGSGRKSGATGNSYGGGGGAYCSKAIPILPSDWGTNISYICGAGAGARTSISDGNTGGTTSSGPVTLNGSSHTLTCTGGKGGTSTSGLGGTASGGTTNTSGGNATGGAPGVGRGGDCAHGGGLGGDNNQDGNPPGGGGGAGWTNGPADNFDSGAGANPRIRYTWT